MCRWPLQVFLGQFYVAQLKYLQNLFLKWHLMLFDKFAQLILQRTFFLLAHQFLFQQLDQAQMSLYFYCYHKKREKE